MQQQASNGSGKDGAAGSTSEVVPLPQLVEQTEQSSDNNNKSQTHREPNKSAKLPSEPKMPLGSDA